MRPLVHDDEEPDASHPLHFPVEATALVFLAAATGTRRIAAYGLPLSPIRGQPQGRIRLIFLIFFVFLIFLIFLIFFLERGERMRHIVPNPAHVPKHEGEDRSQSHEGGDQGSFEGCDGKQETQHPPDQYHSGGEREEAQPHKDHEDSNDKEISHTRALLGCSAGPLGGLAPRCITRALPRGHGAQLGSGWAPCRRRWALHHPSRACHTPRQPTMPQRGLDVHHKQCPTVETVAKVVGHGYPRGAQEGHCTCHRPCQRSPHIAQWFDKESGLPNRYAWRAAMPEPLPSLAVDCSSSV